MNFIFLDSTNNYPFEFSAGNSKVEYMSKALVKLGHKVCVINSRSGYSGEMKEGCCCGLNYVLFKKGNYFQYIKNIYSQCKILRKRRASNENYVILASTFSLLLFFDIIYSKLLGYKILFLFHEMRTTVRTNKTFIKQIDSWLIDHITGYLVNGILPISHYILDYSKVFNKPMFLLPILSDFPPQISVDSDKIDVKNSFVYCGAIAYRDIIDMIIKSLSIINNDIEIKLVLYGSQNKIEQLKRNKDIKKYKVEILQSLSKEDLFSLYTNALGLIIPLNPDNLQDKIRFSQKIAEYVSTKTPIITVNVGEIQYYFRNQENAFIMDVFNAESLAKAMDFIVNNKELAREVGVNGYKTGEKYFSASIVMQEFEKFILTTYSA